MNLNCKKRKSSEKQFSWKYQWIKLARPWDSYTPLHWKQIILHQHEIDKHSELHRKYNMFIVFCSQYLESLNYFQFLISKVLLDMPWFHAGVKLQAIEITGKKYDSRKACHVDLRICPPLVMIPVYHNFPNKYNSHFVCPKKLTFC